MSTTDDARPSTEPGRSEPFVQGQLGYLQLPAAAIEQSARFYRAVFGWQTEPDQAGFEAPGLIGQFVTDREPAAAAGPVIWLVVRDISKAGQAVEGHGGRVVEGPTLDGGERWLLTILDPAGNQVGAVSPA
ncbi:MAG: VOC family protein [Nakamurella sp.]